MISSTYFLFAASVYSTGLATLTTLFPHASRLSVSTKYRASLKKLSVYDIFMYASLLVVTTDNGDMLCGSVYSPLFSTESLTTFIQSIIPSISSLRYTCSLSFSYFTFFVSGL